MSLKGVFERMTVLINKLIFFVSWLLVAQSKGSQEIPIYPKSNKSGRLISKLFGDFKKLATT